MTRFIAGPGIPRARCWVCFDTGYVHHACTTAGCRINPMPCPNPHCAAGVEVRTKRVGSVSLRDVDDNKEER